MWTDERLTERFDRIDQRFDRIDRRFEQVDRRFEQVDARFDGLERRMDEGFREIRGEITGLRRDMHTAMLAMLGATMAALVAVLVNAF